MKKRRIRINLSPLYEQIVQAGAGQEKSAAKGGAKTLLREAISLHQKHLSGAVPTSAASQKQLMSLMEKSLDKIQDIEKKGAVVAQEKKAAKERGMEEHKGVTIPKEVRSLADRIRKKDPSASDEYAYRTAWDIFRSHTPEGKQYPRKSPESGLASAGGGTGPLSKKAGLVDQAVKAIKGPAKMNAVMKKVPPKMKGKVLAGLRKSAAFIAGFEQKARGRD